MSNSTWIFQAVCYSSTSKHYAMLTVVEWASGDPTAEITWEYGVTPNNTAYHKFYRTTQLLFSETNDQAEWGSWYLAIAQDDTLSFESGSNSTLRPEFAANGTLSNTNDTAFRAINDNFPTFAFAKDLGTVSDTPISTLFTVALAQEEAIQFDGAEGIVSLPSLWTDYFPDELSYVCSRSIRGSLC